MTRIFPTLPSDLTKASSYDLLSYLNSALAEEAEEGDDQFRDKLILSITEELLKRETK